MPDFAQTEMKHVGFRRSPFTVFKETQQISLLLQTGKKVGISLAILSLCFLLSLGLISFFFLRVSNWQQKGTTGIAFLTSVKGQVLKETTIVWVDPEKKEIVLMTLPGDLPVHTAGTSVYSLKALYGLYAINHASAKQFQKALARNIRIDTPFFIVREGEAPPSETGLKTYVGKLMLDAKNLSLFPLADRFSLLWYVWFSGAKIIRLEFPSTITQSTQGLDDLSYDAFVTHNFLNVGLKNEGLSLAVVNASAQARLASTVGRLFSAFGFNVLSVSDTPNIQDLGSIFVRDGRLMESETASVLARYISGPLKVNNNITNEYRADIVVFLGKQEATEFIP